MTISKILDKMALGFPILVILLVALLIMRAFAPLPPIPNALSFEQQVWLENPKSGEGNPIRQRMVDDLLAKRDLTGSTQKEIEALLGPRTATDKFPEWDLVYWLGRERSSLPLDSEWLVLKFNDRGVVKRYRLVND
jgi:hypothetical protein